MTRAESIFQTFGDLHLPIEASEVTTTLEPLDPGLAKLMALFKSAINSEYGPVWHKVADALPVGHPLRLSDPVADTLELEPNPAIMQQRKATWPLLCLHRQGEATYERVMLDQERLNQEWGLHYILSPLDIGDLRKLSPICIAVGKLVRLVIRQRGHKSYEAGALQFFPDKGGFASISLDSQEGPGQATFAGNADGPIYYAVSFKLKTTELSNDDLDGYGDYEGTDVSVGVGTGTAIVPDLIQADTSIPFDPVPE